MVGCTKRHNVSDDRKPPPARRSESIDLKPQRNLSHPVDMAGKAKARSAYHSLSFSHLTQAYRTLVVRMISTAQTGYFYTAQRLRQGPRLSAVKYDPRGMSVLPFL